MATRSLKATCWEDYKPADMKHLNLTRLGLFNNEVRRQ
jgi:hypothetical protein